MNRLMGIVPLGLFAAYAAVAVERGRPAEALWMCHIANLLMAIGVFARSPRLIGIAFLWIALGIPLWAMNAWQSGGTTWVSVASHLGGLAFGIYAVSRQRLSSNPWFAALVAFIVLQQACRWWTPEALNVNLAHAEYRTWEGAFGGYWAYWLATTLAAAACLWTIGRLSTRGRKP
jgi:hypothetical protein